jgi:hypothetical protein
MPITDPELADLLRHAITLWSVTARVEAADDGVGVRTADGAVLTIARAPEDARPTRWTLMTPERAAAGRPPRAASSIIGLLSALRAALDAAPAPRLRVGG